MKYAWCFVLMLMMASVGLGSVRVKTVNGDVTVRHGVSETWGKLVRGDTLRADDAIRTGKASSVVIELDNSTTVPIPEKVILEMLDLRQMTQEELLLKLALQDVRSIPSRSGEGDPSISRTTTVHGENRNGTGSTLTSGVPITAFQMNGAKLLFEKGFYATSILRSKDVIRREPELARKVDARLRIAGAFERIQLRLEALTEYQEIAKLPLDPRQKSFVEEKIAGLAKKTGEGNAIR
jgi:hypothetical protein